MAFFTPTKPLFLQRPNYTPDQTGAIGDILKQAQSGLQNTPASFGPIKDYYKRQHVQQTLPALRSQFSQGGSPLLGGLLGAENDLASKLAAMEQKFNMDQRGQFLDMFGLGLTPTFSEKFDPGKSSVFDSFMSDLAGASAKAIPNYLLSGTSAGKGTGSEDEQDWWDWLTSMLKNYGPKALKYIPGAGPIASDIAEAAVGAYDSMPSQGPQRPTPFNQPQRPQVGRNDFNAANLYQKAGQSPQYSPLPSMNNVSQYNPGAKPQLPQPKFSPFPYGVR